MSAVQTGRPDLAGTIPAVALTALASLLPFLGPHPVWGIPAATIVPGLAVARLLSGSPSPIAWLARAAIVGPLLAGLLAIAVEFLDLRDAWPAVLTLFNVTMLGVLLMSGLRGGESGAAGEPRSPEADDALRTAAWIGIALVVLVLLPAYARPWIRERADSWFHAAVVTEIGRTGLPPQDPYFAGFRLQYMWFYHMILFALERSTGLSTFLLMPVVNALALWSLCVLSADLVLALGRNGRAARWAALLVPLSLTALFWLFLPIRALRALTGATQGGDALSESFRLSPLNVPVTRDFLSDFGSSPFFLNKYLTGTAYGLALAFLFLYLASVLRFAARPARTPLVTAGLSVFAMLLLHPVVGLTAVAVSGMTGIVLAILGRRRGGLTLGETIAWGGAALVGALAAFPYLREVTRGKPQEQLVPFQFDPWVTIGIAIGCAFVLLAGIPALVRLWRTGRTPERLFVAWTVATVLFAAVIRLPGPNTTDKFTWLVYLPLAVAAALWAGEKWRGARGALLALLLLLPVNVIGYAGYWGEADGRELSPASMALYSWIAENTPPEAVIVENRERVGVLVHGPRRLYWGREAYADQWGYDPARMAIRRATVAALYDPGARLDEAAVADLRTLAVPVFVVVRAEDFTSSDDFHTLDRYPGLFGLVYDTTEARIYRLIT